MWQYTYSDELYHYGVLGMRWGIRRARKKGTNYTYLVWDRDINHSNEILAEINKHSATIISPNKLEKCLKNSVASSITNIIQNPRNMD